MRDFSGSLVAVVLPAYLVALGYGAAEVGPVATVATVALLGSTLMMLGIGLHRTLVDLGAFLLAAVAVKDGTALGFASAAGWAKWVTA